MKDIAKGELKSVLAEYHMLLLYVTKHDEDVFGKAFPGISKLDRETLQEKLAFVVLSLTELKNCIEEILEI